MWSLGGNTCDLVGLARALGGNTCALLGVGVAVVGSLCGNACDLLGANFRVSLLLEQFSNDCRK